MTAPDVVVVGAGGGGAVAARELAEGGAQVLVLEAGPWLDPDRDFSLLEDDMQNPVLGRIRWGPADRSRGPWMRRRDGAGLILQGAGVGGTTLHYNGISVRAYPSSIDGAWPLPYRDLIPYYERVEELLPVRLVDDLATKDALFARGCALTGLVRSEARDVETPVWRPSFNAILPIARMEPGVDPRHPAAEGCTMSGHCLIGCASPQGAPVERKAKRATNVSYIPAAVATGRCVVEAEAFATRLLWELAPAGTARIRGVRWRRTSSGEVHEAEAPAVVLAGGSIESPRLFMNSRLPDRGGNVGRFLTTHLQDVVSGTFDLDVNPNVGQVTMARADIPGDGCIFPQGYGPQAFAVVLAALGHGTWDDETGGEPWDAAGRAWGHQAADRIEAYSRSLSILVCADDEAAPGNGVTLADDWGPDEHGAVPKVTYRPTPRSIERRDRLARRAAEVLRAAGARWVHRSRIEPAILTHVMGTMRMASDPASGVVDPDGHAHGVDGLFVADASVLPNGVGGVNPTLTAQALATRTAANVLGYLRDRRRRTIP